MQSTVVTIDGFAVPVDVAGPENGSVVVLLSAGHHGPAAYEAVCQRLHTASLRTVVIATDPRLTAKSVVGILDSINVKWALLVGDRQGGELAWSSRPPAWTASSVSSSSTAAIPASPTSPEWSGPKTARRSR